MASLQSSPVSSSDDASCSSSGYGDRLLVDVLRNPEALVKFRAFLAANFCEENLLFYLEVEEFKKQTWTSTEKMEDEIKKIFLKYLIDGAPLEVNVTGDIRAELSNKIDVETSSLVPSSITMDAHIFDELQGAVLELMICDSLPKFLGSQRKSSVSDMQDSSTTIDSPKKLKRTPSARKMNELRNSSPISKLSSGQKRVAMAKKEKLEHFFGDQIPSNKLLTTQQIDSPSSSPSVSRRPLRRTPSIEKQMFQVPPPSSSFSKRRTTKKLEKFFGEAIKQ